MEGAGVYFKASLCGKIYKHFSFLVEEDIRPRDDFKEAEWFNDTRNKMRSDKIRFSTGSNYQLNPNNNLQLYYRYHIFNVDDPVNYRHAIGICYTHRF